MAHYATYPLDNGFVTHWLTADARQAPASQETLNETATLLSRSDIVEMQPLAEAAGKAAWRYAACGEDHLVDLTGGGEGAAWAAVELNAPRQAALTVTLACWGAARLWVNGSPALEVEGSGTPQPARASAQAALEMGKNRLLVWFSTPDQGAAAAAAPLLGFALHVQTDKENLTAQIATASRMLSDRQKLQTVFSCAVLDRYVFAEKERVSVRWLPDTPNKVKLGIQLRKEPSTVFGYNPDVLAEAGAEFSLLQPFEVPEGSYHLRLLPGGDFSVEGKLRVWRDIPIFLTKNPFHSQPIDPIEQRLEELVAWSISQVDNLFAHLILMLVRRWRQVDFHVIEKILGSLEAAQSPDPLLSLGMAAVLTRFGASENLPAGFAERIRSFLRAFSKEEPRAYSSGEEICAAALALLAAQGETTGTAAGRRKAARAAEKRIAAWCDARGAGGLAVTGSAADAERVIFALTQVVDFAENEDTAELAGVLLDKFLFQAAVRGFRGAHPTAGQPAGAPQVFSARFHPLAPVSRLLWGEGALNGSLAAAAGLLGSSRYALPEVIRQAALDRGPAWMREHFIDPDSRQVIDRAAYRTQHYLLASVQGCAPVPQQWQAVLGPEALVFTGQPARSALGDERTPGFWVNSAAAGCTAQWKNTLVSLARLPEDDWFGYSHAYFPAHAFDETVIQGGWAFARLGEAYLALTAAQGLEWITAGESAFRELRSYGRENAWLCRLGDAGSDGSFDDFQHKMSAGAFRLENGAASWQAAGEPTITFGWQQPFLVSGEEQPVSGFPQFDTPYAVVENGAKHMEIRAGDETVRLTFD